MNKLIQGIIIFTVLLTAGVYTYSTLGIDLDTIFSVSAITELISLNSILILVISSIFLGASMLTINSMKKELDAKELTTISLVGTLIATIIGFFFLNGTSAFLLMMLFLFFGFFLLATYNPTTQGKFSKMSFMWGSAKKVTFILGLGAFATAFVFVNADLDTYQNKVKTSIVDITTNFDYSSLITKEDLRGVILQDKSPEDIRREIMIASSLDPDSYDSLPTQAKQQVDAAVEKYYEAVEANIDKTYENLKDKSTISGDFIEDILERIPFFGLMLDLLPLFIGFFAASITLFLGEILLGPISALLGLFLKE